MLLKSYINLDRERLKVASNDSEKGFFKLMNNAVPGKMIENLPKRENVKMVANQEKLSKLVAAPAFDSFCIFSEDPATVNMKKTKLHLNTSTPQHPMYVGIAILDLAKVLTYDFCYNYMTLTHGFQSKLLFMDTDHLYHDTKIDELYYGFLSARNKKVLRKIKDETKSIVIKEFVGLELKIQSILFTADNKPVERKKDKGIAKKVTKQLIHTRTTRDAFLKNEHE